MKKTTKKRPAIDRNEPHYVVRAAPDIQELGDRVTQSMRDGYQPHGSMVIDANGFYQPMVRFGRETMI